MSRTVLTQFASCWDVLIEALPESFRAEALSLPLSDHDQVIITAALHGALRDVTGELLVSHDVERRQAEQHDPQLLNPLRKHWNDIEPLLTDRSPLQRRILAVRLQRGQVDGLELSELRSILRTLRAPAPVLRESPGSSNPGRSSAGMAAVTC